tara:strand:- start:617 stop:1384 length:768 start_codon:yes stop_codon:yes gene_type:complete
MQEFREAVIKFGYAIDTLVKKNLNPLNSLSGEKQLYDFAAKKQQYHIQAYHTAFQQLKNASISLHQYAADHRDQQSTIAQISALLQKIYTAYDEQAFKLVQSTFNSLQELTESIPEEKQNEALTLNPDIIPKDIKSDIEADISEMQRCFTHECFRSCIILCGRVLETVLHRKYYEVTNNDLLEKSPGIGLGNLIAKLRDKEVSLPPGIANQIHLINQARISSVHKQQEAFYPTKAQTEAVILLTIDTASQLFSKQ